MGIEPCMEKQRTPIYCPGVDLPEQGHGVLWSVTPRIGTDQISPSQPTPMVRKKAVSNGAFLERLNHGYYRAWSSGEQCRNPTQ